MTEVPCPRKPPAYNDNAQKHRMPTLIVSLPASMPTTATPCSTVLADNDGTILRHGQTPLALFPELTGGEIVVVVAAAQLSWHRLELPKGTLARGMYQDGNA